jgi:hypothetical protein
MAKKRLGKSTGRGLAPQEVRALYDQCRSKEILVTPDRWNKFKEVAIQQVVFYPPIFGRDPDVFFPEEKYTILRGLLQQADNRDAIWRVLANWLKCEGIRTPKEWLPKSVFQRLTQEKRKRLNKLSSSDFYYAELVSVWLPYVQAFLQESKVTGAPMSDDRLRDLGFDPNLVTLGAGTRKRSSEISLTCEWLAQRGVVQPTKRRADPDPARALRNACSRMSVLIRRGQFKA